MWRPAPINSIWTAETQCYFNGTDLLKTTDSTVEPFKSLTIKAMFIFFLKIQKLKVKNKNINKCHP